MRQPYKRPWKTASGETRVAWMVEYDDPRVIVDGKPKRCREQFPTKKKADARRDALLQELGNEGDDGLNGDATVSVAAKSWLDVCEKVGRNGRPPVEPTTLEKYQLHVDKYIVPRIGSRKIGTFTVKDAKAFQLDVATSTNITDGMRKKVFDSTKALFKEAVGVYITASPFAELGMGHKKGKRRRAAEELMEELGENSEGKRVPTLEDVRTILGKVGELARAEALVSDGKRRGWQEFQALLHTVMFTGGRISEMLGLAWPRIRIAVSKIYIVQRADARGRLGPPKSEAGARSITIPQHLCELLEAWRPHCPEGPHKLVFPNGAGNVESQSNLRDRYWISLLERCELMVTLPDGTHVTPFGFHGFRALRNSIMKAIGVSIENRMDEHGWSSEDMPEKVYDLDLTDPEIVAIRQRSAATLASVMLGKGQHEGGVGAETGRQGAHIQPTWDS